MRYAICLIICLLLAACQSTKTEKNISLTSEEDKRIHTMAKSYFLPLPEINWSELTAADKKRILLGKKLFYDKRLSQNQTINCASCHDMKKFGQDNLAVSPGDSGEPGLRNVPSLLNAHLQFAQFWDTREKNVEDQSAGPIFGKKEMGMRDTLELIERISSDMSYQLLFSEAFPEADTLINLSNIKRSIGAFERTFISPSPFDSYLKGEISALNEKEKAGIKQFIDQGCIPCHSGVLVGGNMAQKFAIFGFYWDYTHSSYLDKGKYDITKDPSDKFVFKVPSLRNSAMTYPYFHDGSVKTLAKAIEIMSLSELNLPIESEAIENIEAFLNALTGRVPNYLHENETFPFE